MADHAFVAFPGLTSGGGAAGVVAGAFAAAGLFEGAGFAVSGASISVILLFPEVVKPWTQPEAWAGFSGFGLPVESPAEAGYVLTANE